MALCIDRKFGYAKLDSFCFKVGGDIASDLILDFGDGSSESLNNRTVIPHIYEDYGTYTACLRTCASAGDIECVSVAVRPYVADRIVFEQAPVSGFASVDNGQNFQVCLSSNCPPPLRVRLSVANTISPPEDKLPDTPSADCLPRHRFSVNEKFEDGVVILENPSQIFVNNQLCGWHDTFCFGYYDDYPSDKELTVVLERTCNECFDVNFDVCEPTSGCSISGFEHFPLPFTNVELGL